MLCCAHQTSINLTGTSFAFGIRLVGFSWSVSLLSPSINQTLTRRSNINTVGHTCYKSTHNRLTLACLLDLAAFGWVSNCFSISDKCVFHSLHSTPTATIVKPLGTHDKCTLKRLWAVCGQQVTIKITFESMSGTEPGHKQTQAAVGRTDGTQNRFTHPSYANMWMFLVCYWCRWKVISSVCLVLRS